ncbi:MAG: M15 family metallopeptidase [Muribaculum sp.]|nr:M15 family metallopeptidase [Muribaculum sp.]
MKTTLEERVKKKLLRFGRQNRICMILAIAALAVTMFGFHAAAYCRGNGKRFAMMALTLCLFVTYSSFSFPVFIAGNGGGADWRPEDVDSDVELAAEPELRPEDMELLMEEETLSEYEIWGEESPYDAEAGDTYDASEILASLEGRSRPKEQREQELSASGEFSKDDWRLVLINKQHSIPDDYTVSLGTIEGALKCDERILDDLSDMLQAAVDDGISLKVRSPYRTHERQVYNFNQKISDYMNRGLSYLEAYQLASQVVTVPGNSEHEIGLALDITCDSFARLEQEFADTDAGKWLAENSCRFGFILRYPKGKEYVTGIVYEPWHFRYVGVEAATVITERGITLEEFWEDLQKDG